MTTNKFFLELGILSLSLPVFSQVNMGDDVKESPTSGAITMSPGYQDNNARPDSTGHKIASFHWQLARHEI